MKVVQINASEDQTMIGLKFIPFREDEKYYYLTYNHMYLKSYCTVIQSDTQTEQWVPKVGEWVCSDTPNCYKDELKGLCGKLLEVQSTPQMCYKIEVDMAIHPNYKGSEALNGKGSVWCHSIYNPLPNEMPQPEPKGYCIKRTPENAEVMNKWANIVVGFKDFTDNKNWLVFDLKTGGIMIEEYAPEGFTELFTVEEFFAKVGYTPETNVLNSTPLSEPKLIAKAGEYIKIIDLGKHDDGSFVLNKPYELINDLTEASDLFIKKNEQGSSHSIDRSTLNYYGMKFELCPAPVSEPVQVDTPIERIVFDLEKWNTGKYDLIQHCGLPCKIVYSGLKSDETLVVVHELPSGEEFVMCMLGHGKEYTFGLSPHDLFLIPKTRTVWVNVWHSEYDNSFEAEIDAKKNKSNSTFIETISITKPIL